MQASKNDKGVAMSDETLCKMHLQSAGLSQRSEPLLKREQQAFSGMVKSLFTLSKAETGSPPLTSKILINALTSKAPGRAYTAAFITGRCQTQDTGADNVLTQALEKVIEEVAEPDVVIEAAMSLALRGNIEHSKQTLLARLNSPNPLGDQYKAAFYLAQMGDPSGYGVLVKTLRSDIPHYRLMAVRHAIAFVPYEAQKINNIKVDVRGLLVERLSDSDELVRSEVPFYLEELQVPDLRSLLQSVVQYDPAYSVRAAALIVLDRDGGKAGSDLRE